MKEFKFNKKLLWLLPIIIIVVIIIVVLIITTVNKSKENEELLRTISIFTDNVDNNSSSLIYKVEDNKIKYVVQNKENIIFYSYDLKTNKEVSEKVLEGYSYCYDHNNESVICYKESTEFESNGDYFSFDMEKLKNKTINIDDQFNNVIETSKGTVKEDGESLYLNDKKIVDISDIGYFLELYETDNDLYYIFNDSNTYTIIRNSNLEQTKLQYKNYFKYNDGYIFRTGKEYAIFDMKNNKVSKYNYDSIAEFGEFFNNLIYQDELILIDSKGKRVIFEQRDTGKLYIYEVKDANSIFSASIYDNYLIFVGSSIIEYPKIYVLDLNLLNREYISYKDYIKDLSETNKTIVQDIKDNYAVNVLLKDEYKDDYDSFKIEYMNDEENINKSLKIIEKTLGEYKKESFEYFKDENYTGLYIYITGKITSIDLLDFSAAGFTLEDEDKHLIILDSNYLSDANIKHELMHSFDRTMIERLEYRIDFTDYNPSDFEYTFDYNVSGKQEYIKSIEESGDNIYFPNGYGTSNRQEDVATIYESVCTGSIDITKFPKIASKYNYIKENMINHIPGIKESECFINY